MAAEPGNQYAVKLKDLATKKKVYEHYCKHLEKGKDKTRWYYEDEEVSLIYESLKDYFEREPEVFSSVKRKKAENKGFQLWEEYCEQTAIGANKEASIPGLNMVMRNKYGWDKETEDSKHQNNNENDVKRLLKHYERENETQPETDSEPQ